MSIQQNPQDEIELELYCGDELAASVSGPRDRAIAEMRHYFAQYSEDGPLTVYRVERHAFDLERAEAKAKAKEPTLGAAMDALNGMQAKEPRDADAEMQRAYNESRNTDTYCGCGMPSALRVCGKPFSGFISNWHRCRNHVSGQRELCGHGTACHIVGGEG